MVGSLWLAPILADVAPFSSVDWLSRSKDGVTIVNKTERVTISQNQAFQDGLAQISSSMVGVKAYAREKSGLKLAREGNGLILTSDGLVATAGLLVVENGAMKVLIKGEEFEASVLKNQGPEGVAFLKIERANLTPVALADLNAISIGQEIFLAALDVQAENLPFFVNRGFVKAKNGSGEIGVNFYPEVPLATGGAIVNERGETVGIALVNSVKEVTLIEADKIRQLLSGS